MSLLLTPATESFQTAKNGFNSLQFIFSSGLHTLTSSSLRTLTQSTLSLTQWILHACLPTQAQGWLTATASVWAQKSVFLLLGSTPVAPLASRDSSPPSGCCLEMGTLPKTTLPGGKSSLTLKSPLTNTTTSSKLERLSCKLLHCITHYELHGSTRTHAHFSFFIFHYNKYHCIIGFSGRIFLPRITITTT